MLPSSERMWNNGGQREALSTTVDLRKPHFELPWWDPWGQSPLKCITHCLGQTSVAVQFRLAVTEEVRPGQTDKQTDSKLNIPHYCGRVDKSVNHRLDISVTCDTRQKMSVEPFNRVFFHPKNSKMQCALFLLRTDAKHHHFYSLLVKSPT